MNPRTQASADQLPTDAVQPWRDRSRPIGDRIADLMAAMTLEEKLAQLVAVWVGPDTGDGDPVAPMQGDFADSTPLTQLISAGIGQLTRVFGTAPVPPADGAQALARLQRRVMSASRFGIPAIAHEECLTGFATWTATAFPAPLAWGASFDPAAVREMAAAIGQSMREVGIHQGLAPVLDVVRDARWGRVEETIGEDSYLVGVIGTAYVQGLQSAGVIATLKHFAGYSASRAGRNMAPVDIGPRAYADVILPPFEMAIKVGGARAVMPSYTSIDGVPCSADAELLTARLRDQWGFAGAVVSDYFAIPMLESQHRVAGSPADAAALALHAGMDVELPHRRCFGQPLADAVRTGQVPEYLVDRAVARVLRQKFELGLLDPGWSPDAIAAGETVIDLDPPGHRRLASQLAEESVVLLANDRGLLPLGPRARLAVVGPLADDPLSCFGCYTFPRHVGYRYPEHGSGLPVQSLLAALRAEFPDTEIGFAPGCTVRSADRSGIAPATAAATAADVAVVVLGDQAGLFGRGTSGEGCDVADLRLPGVQQDLLDAVAQTGVPVVLVVISGRPYAFGDTTDGSSAPDLAAAIQAFFPGQEGTAAIAGVLSGRVTPSGKLPIEIPAAAGGQPAPYLRAPLASRTGVSSVDPTPLYPFGHGLSYTSFDYSGLSIVPADTGAPTTGGTDSVGDARIETDGAVDIGCTVRNSGERSGAEVVQLYLSDRVAQVVRPSRYLAGFARVALEPGQARGLVFRLHADRTAFHGRSGERIVEPGRIDVLIGSSSADVRLTGTITMTGPVRVAGEDCVLTTPVQLIDADEEGTAPTADLGPTWSDSPRQA